MKVSSNGGDYKPVPEGTHIAICIRIVDLGTQASTYKGATKLQRKVLISWEAPDERVRDADGNDMPAIISKRYTASLHEKAALRKDLEAWRGKRFTDDELHGFDLKNVLAQACQIQVLHSENDGTTYANVSAIMSMPKGMPKPSPEHPLINFSLDNGEFSEGVYEMLSDRLKEQIAQSPEYKHATGQLVHAGSDQYHRETLTADLDDEIPF